MDEKERLGWFRSVHEKPLAILFNIVGREDICDVIESSPEQEPGLPDLRRCAKISNAYGSQFIFGIEIIQFGAGASPGRMSAAAWRDEDWSSIGLKRPQPYFRRAIRI